MLRWPLSRPYVRWFTALTERAVYAEVCEAVERLRRDWPRARSRLGSGSVDRLATQLQEMINLVYRIWLYPQIAQTQNEVRPLGVTYTARAHQFFNYCQFATQAGADRFERERSCLPHLSPQSFQPNHGNTEERHRRTSVRRSHGTAGRRKGEDWRLAGTWILSRETPGHELESKPLPSKARCAGFFLLINGFLRKPNSSWLPRLAYS